MKPHCKPCSALPRSARRSRLPGKKVYVALTRGGLYRNTPNDTQTPYLQTVFGFLGMTDVQFVYAEGLAMGAEAEQNALASAYSQIDEVVLT